MHFWLQFIYYLHWALDGAFAAACLSVMFRPVLIARLYVTAFLGQQLILNGCLMTKIQNTIAAHAGYTTSKNQFIMAEVFHGPIVTAYKLLFLAVIIWQLYYITKEVSQWTIFRKFISRRVTSY